MKNFCSIIRSIFAQFSNMTSFIKYHSHSAFNGIDSRKIWELFQNISTLEAEFPKKCVLTSLLTSRIGPCGIFMMMMWIPSHHIAHYHGSLDNVFHYSVTYPKKNNTNPKINIYVYMHVLFLDSFLISLP